MSDLADLQKQVLDRRAELARAWSYQIAEKDPGGSIGKDWNDLASRAWDFAHESASWLNPTGQDDRGRKLLGELYAMYQRFEAEGIGQPAMPATPPPPPPGVDPSHASTPTIASLFDDAEGLLKFIAIAYVFSQFRRR